MTFGVASDDKSNRLKRFGDVESDVGDIVVGQTKGGAEDVALPEDRRVKRGGDGLRIASAKANSARHPDSR